MEPNALAERLPDVQVVDVRYPNEWEAGHIAGSVHLPADELAERLGELARDRPVVAVCRSGERSARAATLLADEGFDAQNLEGGLEAWAAAGLPLTTAAGAAGRVVDPEPPASELPEHLQRLQDEFLNVVFEVQEHFGDRDPSDEEVRAFLRERLIRQGRSPEEADRIMQNL